MDPYYIIIAASLIIIISFGFNVISKKTSIPSVLLLIVLGVGIQYLMNWLGMSQKYLQPMLELLGIGGLIMIVLEASLDLKLTKEKTPLILKSFAVALLSLLGTAFACAYIIHWFIIPESFISSLVYAIPISILSSAIIIPSVGGLLDKKKEFMIYESTFSDILGIMFFYFLIGTPADQPASEIAINVVGNISLTVVISIVVSIGLVLILQRLTSKVKLFLMIAILTLLYAIGKKIFHLSSLIIIMAFGLIISNYKLFFRGPLKKMVNENIIDEILHQLHFVTLETAFVVRTFFFVVFGITISLASLLSAKLAFISLIIVVTFYVIRYILLKVFLWKDLFPKVFIAPRGLITILLFYAIPLQYQNSAFDQGILLYCILLTSIVMSYAIIADRKRREKALEAETLVEGTIQEMNQSIENSENQE